MPVKSEKRREQPAPQVGATISFMKRLPSYDQQGSRSELQLFLGLGLAATTMILITVFDAGRFSNHQEQIAAVLTDQATVSAGAPTNTALTNLAIMHPGPADERARLDGVSKPKS